MGCCKSCMLDCKVWVQVLILTTAIAALVLSILALLTCEFTTFSLEPANDDNFEFGGRNVTSGNLGLFKIEWEGESCRNMNDEEKDDLSWQMTTGRIGIAIGNALGLAGLLLLLIEFTCCRFKGARCAECTLFFFAAVGISLTGFLFASDFCQNPGESLGKGSYPCDFEIGAAYAVASCACYLVVSLFLCVIPKPEPMFVRAKKEKNKKIEEEPEEKEKQGFFAFLFFWRRDKDDEEEEGEEDEENAEANEEGDSVPSNYHDSVAETDEIPEAVVVAAPVDVERRVSKIPEEEELNVSEQSRTSFSFWPAKAETEPVGRDPQDSLTKDMFFDAGGEENELQSQGNLTAEIY